MRRRAAKNALAGALAALVLSLASVALSVPAAGAAAFTPCAAQPGFSCATLSVPLDRSAAVPGSISLHVERLLAGGAPSASAVVALAGGPGQAALPLAGDLAQAIAPALQHRDLIVFD